MQTEYCRSTWISIANYDGKLFQNEDVELGPTGRSNIQFNQYVTAATWFSV